MTTSTKHEYEGLSRIFSKKLHTYQKHNIIDVNNVYEYTLIVRILSLVEQEAIADSFSIS